MRYPTRRHCGSCRAGGSVAWRGPLSQTAHPPLVFHSTDPTGVYSRPALLFLLRCCVLALALLGAGARAEVPAKLTILCYHEIDDREIALIPGYSVKPAQFAQQLAWLTESGYHFVSMDDVLADAAGRRPLPEKALLLSFDDGYRSFYTHAFPILRAHHAPAVVALVGSWLDTVSDTVDFDGRRVPRADLMSWDEIRDLSRSGLVEFASHSYGMHAGVVANPQGNHEPLAIARRWLPEAGRYESESAYRKRIAADLRRSSDLLQRHLGRRPRIIVWPYGRHNAATRSIAARLGMKIGFNLDDGPNTADTPLSMLRRVLVQPTLTLEGLNREIELRNHNVLDNGVPRKIMHVDLDLIYDPDPAQVEDNLGRLLDRINAMGVNTVYLQAYADPDGNGAADAVYFPNRHLPMRADLFNRVAWQIATRTAAVHVYAWMPMLAWQLPDKEPAARDRVVTLPNTSNHLSMGYPRLSPFSPRARQTIREIYEDLGRSATAIEGVLFHDDVTLSDYEDGSPWALKAYRQWGFPQPMTELRSDDALLRKWAARKTAYLDAFAGELADILREEQPGLRTARNLYASVVLNPYSETWYSQSLESSLAHYDYTAIMAMPYMEQAPDPVAFLRQIVDRVAEHPGAMRRVVIELQTVDWRRNDEPLPGTELADTIRRLYGWGVKNVAYYPDNLFRNNPDPTQLRPVFALQPNIQPLSELIP
ncbi:MAG: poly-beta-1,6-N-acetyl-D-glucosamine N-deacetylase PgaB [Gammaproteobacteria bacterium]|nr:poly-beta-1,6-N-acetyl-D-glucosamine N-deacetylase PgaB [Gammaproteobacteria bacterium]